MLMNWQLDGWNYDDWNALTGDTGELRAIARELDNAVGGGGGGFEPAELAEFACRVQTLADRLKRLAGGYL